MTGPDRGAFTLVELTVALAVFGLLGTLAVRTYAELATATRRHARVSDELWAMRATRSVLRNEVVMGAPGVDWTSHAPDSLRVRAFRGLAFVCGVGPDTSLVVRRRSPRRPDPAKDSLLVLDASGTWSVRDLAGVTSSACPDPPGSAFTPGAVTERWRMDEPAEDAVLVRLFERGSYHLASRALRYRRGGGGRQPLTAEVFETARFVQSPAALRARMTLRDGPTLDVRIGSVR
jgi:prepilin-type N-terminal cleavage/methylation domain-containing protein